MAKSRRTTTHRPSMRFAILFLVLTNVLSCAAAAAVSTVTKTGCMDVERDALLAFKADIISDPWGHLSSWRIHGRRDCCSWSGVVCSNSTGTTSSHVHVVELNLRGASVSAEKLSPALLSLTHLELLDISLNDFGGIKIPEFLGSFKRLRHLDLSWANFSGAIPSQLGNLSTLTVLDLSIWPFGLLRGDNLGWLLGFSSLTYLNMNGVDLSKASHNWLSVISKLHSLRLLGLCECGLASLPSSFSHLNLTALTILGLSSNKFNSTLPSWLWQLSSLSYLDLADNHFYGTIPSAIGNLTRLESLDLSYNLLLGPLPMEISKMTQLEDLYVKNNSPLDGSLPMGIGNLSTLSILVIFNCSLSGPIPVDIGKLTSLRELNLGSNLLSGPIPIEIGKLFYLESLDLSFNVLDGNISKAHFANLKKLQELYLSRNFFLSITMDHNWLPPLHLNTIYLDSCKLITSPTFPTWLRYQNFISELNLSNTSIEVALTPNHWFWNSYSSTIKVIDLSHNKISGTLPRFLVNMTNLFVLNLGFNLFEGPVPPWPPLLDTLDLSNNFFSGLLPSTLQYANIFTRHLYSQISFLVLSYNHIEGSIPSSICNLKYIELIDLSNNKIDGKIPTQCWHVATGLSFIILGNNKLTGRIPTSIGSLINLRSLHLNKNNLYGHLPSQLQNCSSLNLIDFGENKLSGNIPAWMGSFQILIILRLRSNFFSGSIPSELGRLSALQVIDFANNRLSGSLPYTFGNFSAISSITRASTENIEDYPFRRITDKINSDILIVTKGREYNFSALVLSLAKIIDVSNNSLTGTIPIELGTLGGLQTLNLSRNYFTGKIPETISGMSSLETLDLSFNNLEGEIPQGLAELNLLSHLNLSYNNLSGNIPMGYQLQTLEDASIYIGNAYLCGAFLNKSCSSDKNVIIFVDEEETLFLSIHFGAIIGFLVGLWSVFTVLLFKKAWRCFFFRAIDELYDKAYVVVKIRMNRFMSN